ncbi:hypothetical protein Dimus_008761 [Dionaea muscipula]
MSKLSSPPQIQCPRVKRPPWSDDREQRKKIQEEYERRRMQLRDLCLALKAKSVSDLQDILFSMLLSECVYKLSYVAQGDAATVLRQTK